MIITISFDAAPGKRDELVAKLQSILPHTRAFDGCNAITLTEATDQPGSLMLLEDWASGEQYEVYKMWRKESGTTVLGTDLVLGDSLSSNSYMELTG